ncbi:MAG: CcmD family protein [Acidobacteria bacterium]|nr:CcmD family protein [Acidobacteriota bacterium]
MVVNLVIWTGLFLYLRRMDRKVRELETTRQPDDAAASERRP